MTQHKHRLFGPASFYRSALAIAMPVMMQLLIQNMVSLIDNFMVAGLGDVKMSGVNVAGQIIFVFMVLISSICTAGGIFLTQYFGAKDEEGMRHAFRFKLLVCGAAILLYMAMCFLCPRSVLRLMVIGNSQAEAILDEGSRYLFMLGFMGFPFMLSSVISASLRETGEVRMPLIISVTATCVNTLFNWLLIYGNLGFPRLEVRGAALATILARTVEAVLYIECIRRRRSPFLIRLRTLFHVDLGLFVRILKKGTLILFADMVWVLTETVTTAVYNGRGGADVVSGMASSFAIANLFFVALNGMAIASSVVIGKSLGAGKLDEARREKTWLLSASVVFGVFMLFVALLTMALVPVVFGNLSPAAQKICRDMVMVMALYMPVWVFGNAAFSVARAGGDTAMGAWMDGVSNLGVIIPGIFLMARFTAMGPVMMYVFVKSIELPKNVFAWWWLKKERWVKNLTVQPTEE